jgi:aminopeptidase YwaD
MRGLIAAGICVVAIAAGAAVAAGVGQPGPAAAGPSAPASYEAGPARADVAGASGVSPYRAAVRIARIGPRPAGGRGERRAHAWAARRFGVAGLDVVTNGFRVPARRRSRNVIGILDRPQDCLWILMAHTDGVPPGQGANDNGSGVGTLIALAPKVRRLRPRCDVWLVATGAEERVVTGTGYHVGAAALVERVKRKGRARDLRFALSVDMVGRGKRFYLRSPRSRIRRGVERRVLAAARRAKVRVNWERDSGSGNSDHREFELAGLPAMVIQVWRGHDACHHDPCDRAGRLQKPALRRVSRVLRELLSG